MGMEAMDLSYGSEMEGFREEVQAFLEANWPLGDEEKELPFEKQAAVSYTHLTLPTKA